MRQSMSSSCVKVASPSLRMARHTSPGIRRITTNTMMVMRIIVGMKSPTRLIMYCLIYPSPYDYSLPLEGEG